MSFISLSVITASVSLPRCDSSLGQELPFKHHRTHQFTTEEHYMDTTNIYGQRGRGERTV